MEKGERIDDTPVHGALREALANCLVNADYYGSRGLVIIKGREAITISNPGGFRIDIQDAISGGVSDPRNAALIKMFNLINIGERVGSGIPNIYRIWQSQGWKAPVIEESFDPERISLVLPLRAEEPAMKTGDKKPVIKTGDKKVTAKTAVQRGVILDYLTVHVTAPSSEPEALLGVKGSRLQELLGSMAKEELIVAEEGNKSRRYRLKS